VGLATANDTSQATDHGPGSVELDEFVVLGHRRKPGLDFGPLGGVVFVGDVTPDVEDWWAKATDLAAVGRPAAA
jgi:hypothetical protein